MEQSIAVVGTVRSNTLKGSKTINSCGRKSEVKTCEIDGIELRVIRWFDNRAVSVLLQHMKPFNPLPK